ncbi:SHOCT domain-containing protein [Ferrigenium sp. UT5]
MMNNGAGGWMMGGMGLLSVLFWILTIVGVVLIVRWLTARNGQGKVSPAESPLDILKTRYAKGEIDKSEFDQKKRDLGE